MTQIDSMNPYEPPRSIRRSWLPAAFTMGLGLVVLTGLVISFLAWPFIGGYRDMRRDPNMYRGPVEKSIPMNLDLEQSDAAPTVNTIDAIQEGDK